MKTLFNKKTILITAAALIFAMITLVSVNVYGTGGPVTGLANAVSSPLRALMSTVAHAFESIYGNLLRYEQTRNELEEALLQIAILRQNYADASELATENEQLREILGFRERNPERNLEEAGILSWSSTNWSSSFTIDRGSNNSDISIGNSVVTRFGALVGIVTDVGPTTSTVVSVLDTTFSAHVLIGEGGRSATAKGDFSLMNQGRLMLDHIDDDIPVMRGNAIVTSGEWGVFPPGLIIGEVEDIFNHSTGLGRYATIRPVVALDTITLVFAITEFEFVF